MSHQQAVAEKMAWLAITIGILLIMVLAIRTQPEWIITATDRCNQVWLYQTFGLQIPPDLEECMWQNPTPIFQTETWIPNR